MEKQAYTYRNSEQIPLLFVVPSPHKLRLHLDRMTANLNSISISDMQEFMWVVIGAKNKRQLVMSLFPFVMPTGARISES
jgi:hypothetical protein